MFCRLHRVCTVLKGPFIWGGSRGRVQGVHTPLRLPNTTQSGILPKKMWFIGVHQSVTPFLSGAPPPKKILDPPHVFYGKSLKSPGLPKILKKSLNSTVRS